MLKTYHETPVLFKYPFFFGRKASISEKAFVLSFMESLMSAMASMSSGLNLGVEWFSLHLIIEKKDSFKTFLKIGKVSEFCSQSTNYPDILNSDANEAFIKPFYLSLCSFTSKKQNENTQISDVNLHRTVWTMAHSLVNIFHISSP